MPWELPSRYYPNCLTSNNHVAFKETLGNFTASQLSNRMDRYIRVKALSRLSYKKIWTTVDLSNVYNFNEISVVLTCCLLCVRVYVCSFSFCRRIQYLFLWAVCWSRIRLKFLKLLCRSLLRNMCSQKQICIISVYL